MKTKLIDNKRYEYKDVGGVMGWVPTSKRKILKAECEKYKGMYFVANEMRQHYEELNEAGIGELHFRLLQINHLYNALEEIETMTTDNLAKEICINEKKRHDLDKLIHARTIFGK
jgi:hypothetical protein